MAHYFKSLSFQQSQLLTLIISASVPHFGGFEQTYSWTTALLINIICISSVLGFSNIGCAHAGVSLVYCKKNYILS